MGYVLQCCFVLLLLAGGVTPVAAGSSPAPAATLALATIVNRYAQAIGGRSVLVKIRSQVSVYTFDLMGYTVTLTTENKPPSYYLQVVTIEGSPSTSTGFDGKLAWLRSTDGVVQILSGTKRAELITEAAGANNSELFEERWPTQLALRPSEAVDGKLYYVVSVTPKDGVEHDLLLDANTFQPVIDRSSEAGVTSTAAVNEFTTGPLGELDAKVVTTTRSDGLPTLVTTLHALRDNVPIPNSVFSPPASAGTETI